jgi:hypothetical protein
MKNSIKFDELKKNKDSIEKELDKIHSDDLGLDLPKDYFAKSKNEILEKVDFETHSKTIALYKSKIFWFAAAGIAVIVALSVFKPNFLPEPNSTPSIVSDTVEQIQNYGIGNTDQQMESDFLVASLFVDENHIDRFIDNHIIEESLIDEYIDTYLLDEMVNDPLVF